MTPKPIDPASSQAQPAKVISLKGERPPTIPDKGGPRQGARGLWQRLENHLLQKVAQGTLELKPSAMQLRFGLTTQLLFQGCFDRANISREDQMRIREYCEKGTLVYVMYCRSILDYFFFNHLFLKCALPLACFANGLDLARFGSWTLYLETLLARFFYWRRHGALPDPALEGEFERCIEARRPALVFLTHSRSVLSSRNGFSRDLILALLELQKRTPTPIFVLPQLVLWQRGPERQRDRNFFDYLFGDPEKPGFFRKFFHFLRYRTNGEVRFGEVINLKEFLEKEAPQHSLPRTARRLRWKLRHYLFRERKASVGPLQRHHARVINRIIRHSEVQSAVDRWVEKTGHPRSEGMALLRKYVKEIVPDRRFGVILFLDMVLKWVWKVFFDGVVVDAEQLKAVREASKDHPVVFVSSHKSHIDYLVIAWIMHQNELSVPHICAGINLNFWPIGNLFKGAGAFFIRRSYPEHDIYPTVLRRYIRELLIGQESQLFFIEGGRSRTGKLLRPKFGILNQVVSAQQDNVSKDITVIPISVGYDRVIEEKSYSDEAHGGEKAKEDLNAFLRVSRKIFGSRFGKIYVFCGEALSLSQYLKEHPAEGVQERLASRICYGINRVSVVFPTALLSLVLLSHRKRGMSRADVMQRARFLATYLVRRKVRFSDAFGVDQRNTDYALNRAFVTFETAKLIRRIENEQNDFFTVEEPKRLVMGYYKNNIIHFFTTFSLVGAILLALHRRSMDDRWIEFKAIEEAYEFLRELFRYEFYFRPKEARANHIHDIFQFFAEEGFLEVRGTQAVRLTSRGMSDLPAIRDIVFPFIETYALAFEMVRRMRGRELDEKILVKETRLLGRRLFDQGQLHFSESLNQFSLQNAISAQAQWGILDRGRGKGLWKIATPPELFGRWTDPLRDLFAPDLGFLN